MRLAKELDPAMDKHRFFMWLKSTGNAISPCNCGGPQDGTDHSPDCEYILSADELWNEWKEES